MDRQDELSFIAFLVDIGDYARAEVTDLFKLPADLAAREVRTLCVQMERIKICFPEQFDKMSDVYEGVR